jgi:serine/threonine-protein kinase
LEVEVGKVIGGKYRLTRLLGRGGMGQVWVARHKTLEQDVAIKLMTPMDVDGELAEGAETALARFQLEAQVAASLSKRSRHIVAVTDHGYEDGHPYLVMDLLQGEGLDALLDRDRVLPVERVVTIVTQVARGLAAAHAEGVVHRDLKPANVFLTRDEDGNACVKLVDFGIAGLERRTGGARTQKLTGSGIVLGSPHYMSPEQARGLDPIDRHVDLWALTVVAYEALTGVMPFDGKTPEDTIVRICMDTPKPIREVRPTLPSALDGFFARAFARSVADRFASAEELASAFQRAALGDARGAAPSLPDLTQPAPVTEAPTVGEAAPSRGASTNRTIVLGVLGAVALFAIVGLAWRVAHPSSDGSETPAAATAPSAPAPTSPPPETASTPTASIVTATTTASAPSPRAPLPSARATVTTTTIASGATPPASTNATPRPNASTTIDKGAIF